MILKVSYKLIALFLTFALLANNINNLVIVTDFVINQDLIAKTLCIQKEEQKGCNGKCQLTKQLVENNTDPNSDTPLPSSNRTQLDVFIIASISAHTTEANFQVSSLQNTIDYRQNEPTSGFYVIDTPPPNLS
ncbi:hypothetical protein [Winogradskyella sediminis]|uniref:Uncharacterized protein n=1 Tax=Winogradskyella sediminis TaxID=1382466 RepID=A0A1H1TAP5_9FLAO|nr:hypothetical protein [Winogradskyella sediminis]SDS57332.1 hypothetical protein SAMN04489797_1901 [Winogradskyella sediminis]